MGHTGGLINPRPWRERCRAGYSNTGGPPLPPPRGEKPKTTLIIFFFRKMQPNCTVRDLALMRENNLQVPLIVSYKFFMSYLGTF